MIKKTLLCLFYSALLLAAISTAYPQTERVTVLNPKGTPPPVPITPMAPRPESLEGKTVYFVDVKKGEGGDFLKAVMEWFTHNIPAARLEFREKAGEYTGADPALWAEIKEKGDAVVLAIGN